MRSLGEDMEEAELVRWTNQNESKRTNEKVEWTNERTASRDLVIDRKITLSDG